jgi:hypothetical protein
MNNGGLAPNAKHLASQTIGEGGKMCFPNKAK